MNTHYIYTFQNGRSYSIPCYFSDLYTIAYEYYPRNIDYLTLSKLSPEWKLRETTKLEALFYS